MNDDVLALRNKEQSRFNAVRDAVGIFANTVMSAIDKNGVAWVGIGTGSTISLFMTELTAHLSSDLIDKCYAVPTSFQSQQLILSAGMKMGSLSQASKLDIVIDGADEVDSTGSFAIKGGGGAHTLEKIVALSTQLFIIIIDSDKVSLSQGLGTRWKQGIPLAILPDAYELVKRKCSALNYSLSYRTGSGKIGPVISDQGHIIADLKSPDDNGLFHDPIGLGCTLSQITGIVEHGLFCNTAHLVIIGTPTGSYHLVNKKC